ncbi:hypothetical protein [Rhodopila sp.]|jgi:hypothetical protein|uniref:hypothetical protein n=1 Tax=Rhodopila sp. TaxID=2480087 RepID=UPI002CB98DB0|nr:hypothetical protein [Rhodopila sp.]HVZ09879.1 hypothetical protein [Rhodopila sp.]
MSLSTLPARTPSLTRISKGNFVSPISGPTSPKNGRFLPRYLLDIIGLDIIGRFLHLNGKEALIFPRFHQIAAVLKMLAHACANGSGNNYPIRHSAGSGKSNTIAWTAHRLVTLHDPSGQPVFDTAIVVTDRRPVR